MTDLEKIANLIKSDDSSNWKLAFELSHLLDYKDKRILLMKFIKKDSDIVRDKHAMYSAMGLIPYIPSGDDELYHSGTLVKIIKDLTKMLENESGRTE